MKTSDKLFEPGRLAELVPPLLNWYAKNARILPWRENRDPYRIWISEIMLQQTRVEAVKPYYLRFLQALPTVEDLAAVDDEVLLKLWEGLGYYSRARNLKKAAQIICSQYGGAFPKEKAKLQLLPGIGEYTAGAISSIAFDEKEPAVDGNVLRLLSRLFAWDYPIDDPLLKKQTFAALKEVYPDGRCGDFTQSLMELGALICLPNGMPKCEECPLSHLCIAAQKGSPLAYPVKKQKPPRRTEKRTVFLLCFEDELALRKRQEKGVLQGMWELPGTEGHLTKEEALSYLSALSIIPEAITPGAKHKHVFTHLEWVMESYLVICHGKTDGFLWCKEEELKEKYSLPSAFRPFLKRWSSLHP